MTTQQPEILSQVTQNTETTQNPSDDTLSQTSSPIKIDKQAIKQKRKKTAALKNFLNYQKKSQQIIAPTRKEQNEEVIAEAQETCKVCFKQVMKKKNCGFCDAIACNDHMRKKRKHPKSGKFVKICDDCEDKHLFQKYMKSEIKAEQALQLQEMIIAEKHRQLTDVLDGKKTRMNMLQNKRRQIDQHRRVAQGRLSVNQNQIRNKQRKLQSKMIDLDKLQRQILTMQKNVPRSLQQDHQALTQQNEKITKQLVKYEKLCQQALKLKSKKEKQMYEQYYKWEDQQKMKINRGQKKDDCIIY